MNLIRLFLACVVSLSFISCAGELPVTAQMEKGELFMGTIRGNSSKATYMMRSLEGKTVQGTYSPRELKKTNVFNFTISDGRTGFVLLNRVGISGYGFGKLSTGEKVKLMYGADAVSMEMSAGF